MALGLGLAWSGSTQATPSQGITITVDTRADLIPTSNTHTCTYTEGAFFFPANDGACTLRRALREASARPDSDRPITIAFNLDPSEAEDGVWTVEIESALLQLFRKNISITGGQVIIDGSTQPGGRDQADGPKIMVETNDWSLEVRVPNNEIRNLGFKGGGTIILYEGGNLIENVWMGLTNDGQRIQFRTGQSSRMAGGGIFIRSSNNVIRNNVISGAFAKAVDVNSGTSNNLIENNFIGTRADGTVPTPFQCTGGVFDPGEWYGGWGISLAGTGQQVMGNTIAGLDNVRSTNDTPPRAIEIFGSSHEIRDNVIGVDSAGNKVGVCGQGIKVSDTGTNVIDNRIVGSKQDSEDAEAAAILTTGASTGITVRGNIVEDGPGEIYNFGGTQVAQALRLFRPARITQIDGVTISGESGENSPCPNCIIDLYLDNDDDVAEALTYLGSVTADGDGEFTFTLDEPLADGFGIRTTSTTQSLNVIPGMQSQTTTRNSALYLGLDSVTLDLPETGSAGANVPITVIISSPNATRPMQYTIEATDRQPASGTFPEGPNAVGNLLWNQPGVKTVTVTVTNGLSTVTDTKEITIESDGFNIYLPSVIK
jgi:hypothetical protein